MIAIIGKNDKVLYSIATKQGDINSHQQFQIHAALDFIEQRAKQSGEYFLKEFADDMDAEFVVYYYLTTLDAKFILMQDRKEPKKEDKIKGLLQNIHKLYTMVLMNPLHPINGKIRNDQFNMRVLDLINEYLS